MPNDSTLTETIRSEFDRLIKSQESIVKHLVDKTSDHELRLRYLENLAMRGLGILGALSFLYSIAKDFIK